MSDNPFKIIRSTDQPPEHLRKDVISSTRLVILYIRFIQLFIADHASVLFEQFRVLDRKGPDDGPANGATDHEP